ncbi:FAD binding domain-containing protein [Nocardioides sp. YIM 152315]|uniref:xanthine dehydrogenase small subunit n=1 Tax=Nocardioides sp. YIM 152315 TaxID=3031760 RepID=UPI0023DA9D64|nr:FAD binding domain-containing protein [Nocardioides sp. YIM 152315]MDF1602866.1 FAD binding domain-containing protein [Nocardioides sp. YIM 152315]
MAEILVNGTPHSLDGVPLHTNALDFVRGSGLTGAKEGCAEGECGACAVLVARPAPDGTDATEWTAVNSCLVPAAALDGQEVVTVEGLGTPGDLHPVQREMAVRGGSQCGYCTPGFVCSMAAEFYRPARTADGYIHDDGGAHGPNGFDLHALSGNLCRCTGYRPIRDAAFALGTPTDDDELRARCGRAAPAPVPTDLRVGASRYVRPRDLAEATRLLAEHPDAVVVAGNTDWGVEVNLRGRRAPMHVAVDRLPELRASSVTDDELRLGAALTLSEVARRVDGLVPLLAALMPQFASPLIRNSATLGGNIGTASPIGDGAPVLLALDASLVLASTDRTRTVPLAEYFTGYRQSIREPGELITELVVPLPVSTTSAFHKIAKRRFDDISSVAAAFALDVRDGVVRKARIGLGGVAATPLRATRTEAALEGRSWSAETVATAADVMATEGTPISDARSSADYRIAMLGQALRKLFEEVPA